MLTGNERVMVQGITGKYGRFHTEKMLKYGTGILCGTSKNAAEKYVHGVPVFESVKTCVERFGVDTSIVFVPAPFAKDAVMESLQNGIKKVVIITEHIPVHDTLTIVSYAKKGGAKVLGPNCPGAIVPGKIKLGIMPEKYFKPGSVAIISRSGTLMYEIASIVSRAKGISIAMGLGGDPIVGTNVYEAFKFLMEKGINKVVVVGEIGPAFEVDGIRKALNDGFNGEIAAFFAGRYAPKGKRMGHAGAIVEGESATIEYKEAALKEMGIFVAKTPSQIAEVIERW